MISTYSPGSLPPYRGPGCPEEVVSDLRSQPSCSLSGHHHQAPASNLEF